MTAFERPHIITNIIKGVPKLDYKYIRYIFSRFDN
ncbi:hypothetical protein IMSAGC008_00951 [Muribaculaceae bacterium]|jgi:hypothetical protein|nr:hypothetical protein IMSAGC008_00951 [Muribaculaceae bacterium]